jgi:TRAP-type C4-dicarboxylate transport system permease small subunit
MQALSAALDLLATINRATLATCRLATIGLVAAIAIVIAASVFWRYALNDALSWAEEVSKYLMIWMVFTGAPIALRRGGHVAIEIFPNALPDRAKQLVFALVFLAIAALMVVLIHRGSTFAWNGRTQTAIIIGDFSLFWLFVSIPLGAAIMLLVALEAALRRFAHALDPERFPLAEEHDYAQMVSE